MINLKTLIILNVYSIILQYNTISSEVISNEISDETLNDDINLINVMKFNKIVRREFYNPDFIIANNLTSM